MNWLGPKIVERIGGFSWTPTDGLTVRPRFEGERAAIISVANQLRNAGIPHEVDFDGPIGSVEALGYAQGSPDEMLGFWELSGQAESVDIREHPNFKSLTDAEKYVINRCVDGIEKFPPSAVWTYKTNEDDPGHTVTPSDTAKEFYRLVYNGQLNYFRTGRVLRHTLIISSAHQASVSLGNADKIYTTEQVIAEGEEYDDPIPEVIKNEMQLLRPNGPVPDNHLWGWLKQSPSIRTTSGWKLEVSVEYLLEAWPLKLYEQR